MNRGNIALFVPHVGCPCRCSFCDQWAITGGAQPPTPAQVWEAAQAGAQRWGSQVSGLEIAFFGGSFTAIPRQQILSLLEPAKQAVERWGYHGIRCSTRPDAVDEETLALLKRYHATAVELGAQSMDEEVLRLNRRGHTAQDTRRAAALIKGAGLELGLQMMTGLYGSTPEKDLDTARQLIALGPDTARIYPTIVLEHTELARLYREGLYRPQTLEEAVELCGEALPLFEDAGVRVIRMGLHAQTDVEARKVAGPYHPAFRELVESRVFLRRLEEDLKRRGPGCYRVKVHPKSLSVAVGQKRKNLEALACRGFTVRMVPEESVPRGEFLVEQAEIE